MSRKLFEFMPGPWENSDRPTLVQHAANGGDPRIIGVFARIHDAEALHALCEAANTAIMFTSPSCKHFTRAD